MGKPRFSCLDDWLAWLEQLHPQAIDLGLQRVYQVACRLQLLQPSHSCHHSLEHDNSGTLAIPSAQVVTVAGTNGKGSCIATLEQCLVAQDYCVGSYSSPHLHHYNERIRINGEPVSERSICHAFSAIDQARGNISLTYFEFGTLAALWIFVQQQVPFVLLEVGLGGRLDAVNIVDADIAVVTSIAVDHEEWLGNDREQIAIEKLGITRATKPVIITERELTQSLQHFIEQHSPAYTIDRDFFASLVDTGTYWQWSPDQEVLHKPYVLPVPALPLTSVVAALQVLYCLNRLPSAADLEGIVEYLALPGRNQQYFIQGVEVIFDVAHNPAAAAGLAERLQRLNKATTTRAVFAVMADKNIQDIIAPLFIYIDDWYSGDLTQVDRAASVEVIEQCLLSSSTTLHHSATVEAAFDEAFEASVEHDRIVVFGSFFTVAAIQQYLGLVEATGVKY